MCVWSTAVGYCVLLSMLLYTAVYCCMLLYGFNFSTGGENIELYTVYELSY